VVSNAKVWLIYSAFEINAPNAHDEGNLDNRNVDKQVSRKKIAGLRTINVLFTEQVQRVQMIRTWKLVTCY